VLWEHEDVGSNPTAPTIFRGRERRSGGPDPGEQDRHPEQPEGVDGVRLLDPDGAVAHARGARKRRHSCYAAASVMVLLIR
jgi:hypothetical protein